MKKKCFDVPTRNEVLEDLEAKYQETRVHQLHHITFSKCSHVPVQSCPGRTRKKESLANKLELQTSDQEIQCVPDGIAPDDTLSVEKINMLIWEVGFWPLEGGGGVREVFFLPEFPDDGFQYNSDQQWKDSA